MWVRVEGGYDSMAAASTNQKSGPSRIFSLGKLSSPVFSGQWNQFSVSGLKKLGLCVAKRG